uniref:ARAD1B18876p n=1 Tax=Blastobotrys adeninivorans TaxID=409370 RepID=A0A060T6I6_BLAAD
MNREPDTFFDSYCTVCDTLIPSGIPSGLYCSRKCQEKDTHYKSARPSLEVLRTGSIDSPNLFEFDDCSDRYEPPRYVRPNGSTISVNTSTSASSISGPSTGPSTGASGTGLTSPLLSPDLGPIDIPVYSRTPARMSFAESPRSIALVLPSPSSVRTSVTDYGAHTLKNHLEYEFPRLS